ncbi:MAG: rod-binding protein [Rhodospirillales bacterium]|nr:rod-binding protein [Rhodospirillales bacterium]
MDITDTTSLISAKALQLTARAGQAKTTTGVTPPDPAREAAKEFEAMILGVMLEPMFQGIKSDGPLGGGQSEKVFRSMLIQEYAKSISNSGGIGVADAVYTEMLKMQELK